MLLTTLKTFDDAEKACTWPLFELAVRVSDSALVDAAAVVST